jgi:hypothetical protein
MECCASKIACDGGPIFSSALFQKLQMKDTEVAMKEVEDNDESNQGAYKGRGLPGCSPPNKNLKNTDSGRHSDIKCFR